jgi:hypothetical protein
MTEGHGVASVRALFSSEKAIRSESQNHGTVWFYRHDVGKPILVIDGSECNETDIDTVRRNINHDLTDVTTHPVEDSPFRQ